MASLDWQPVVAPEPGWRPVMLTLTLPGDWLAVARTGEAFKQIMRRFWAKWERRWSTWDCPECGAATVAARGRGVKGKRRCAEHGLVDKDDCTYSRRPFRGVWKLEFQRRGAPHLHLYCAVPVSPGFRQWLSTAWYQVVGSGDPRHLAAGTREDWGEGIAASDPKRLAVYFLKRATGHNVGGSKEYQHVVPLEWQGGRCARGVRCRCCDADEGPGRFWGYKGLVKATAEVELDERQFVQLRRLLRRWAAANGRAVRSLSGGRGLGGLVLANDAPMLLAQASRWDALGLSIDTYGFLNRQTGEVHDWHPAFGEAGRHHALMGLVTVDDGRERVTGSGIESGEILRDDPVLRQLRRERAYELWREGLREAAQGGRDAGTQDLAKHPATQRPDHPQEYARLW